MQAFDADITSEEIIIDGFPSMILNTAGKIVDDFFGKQDSVVTSRSEQLTASPGTDCLLHYEVTSSKNTGTEGTITETNHVLLQIAQSDVVKTIINIFGLKPVSFDGSSDEKEAVSAAPIPFPTVLKTDVWPTESSAQQSYILFSLPANAASVASLSSPQTPTPLREETDTRLGAVFSSIHKVYNLWYGIPSQPEEWDACQNWQECFTALFHAALTGAERAGMIGRDLVEQLQRAMFDAVAYFLFDDVEVPSLIYNPGLEWESTVFVSHSAQEGGREKEAASGGLNIAAMYGWTDAIWGDPLMEAALRDPSKAFIEGYGENPIVFERQKTKKLWYLAYAALTSMNRNAKSKGPSPPRDEEGSEVSASVKHREVRKWDIVALKELLERTADKLKDAPCY